MSKLTVQTKRFLQEDHGGTAAEYGIVVGVIAMALIAGLVVFKDAILNMFDRMGADMDDVAP